MYDEILDADEVTEAIDAYWHLNQEDGKRGHLGASLLGRPCDRELWYSFRWAGDIKHDGRLLRLFDRGHKEEFRFIEYLQQLGAQVYETDPQTGEQFRMKSESGHCGGSLDTIATHVPGVERLNIPLETAILVEYKTHGEKSFKRLESMGLKETKFEHFIQMQLYMQAYNLPWALYMAVNKNTDHLKCIWVKANPQVARDYLDRGERIVYTPTHPKRIATSASASECRFCDFKGTCWLGKAMAKNCRTCSYAETRKGGIWYCNRWSAEIPLEAQKEGCTHYNSIKD